MSMSSKLNLAGNYLSLPVNELGNEYRLCYKLLNTHNHYKYYKTIFVCLSALSMSLEMSKDGIKYKALLPSLVPFSFLFSRSLSCFFLFILPLVSSLGPFLYISLNELGGVNHKALVL